ncbi:hypothetical protein VNO80_16015 [Phaseolus coccineus]|uniref:Uncharacterized protein n=1 Tax=Phaseolus coccineus TaxID=3886 RepID=A0AAN9MLC8_PHACN
MFDFIYSLVHSFPILSPSSKLNLLKTLRSNLVVLLLNVDLPSRAFYFGKIGEIWAMGFDWLLELSRFDFNKMSFNLTMDFDFRMDFNFTVDFDFTMHCTN